MVIIFDNFDETTSRNAGPECIKQSTLIITIYTLFYILKDRTMLSLSILYIL